MNSITYEIHHINGEILADNLTFEDVPILFQAYQEWYNEGCIIACYRVVNTTSKHPKSRLDEFREDWHDFMNYLITLDNI